MVHALDGRSLFSASRQQSPDGDAFPAPASRLGAKPPTRWEELTPGLLLFFARPSRLQSFGERFGHPFRHVGITVQTPDGLRVASYSASQCYRIDDLEELLPNYNRIAVASVGATADEQQAIGRWCSSFENLERKQAPYTKSGILIGPMLDVARRRTGPVRWLLIVFLVLYARFQDRLDQRRPSFVCSTFVWRALVENTNNRVRLPMTSHPDDQAAYATPVTDLDELLARWFCGPGDLWRGISPSHRSELELDHLSGAVASPAHDNVDAGPKVYLRNTADLKADLRVNIANYGDTTTGKTRSAASLALAPLALSISLLAERLLRAS